MRAVVTGGAGFIGHHLVQALLQRGDDVVVLDDCSTGRISRIEPLLDDLTFIAGSIEDRLALDRALRGREVVFHLAALPSVARSVVDPLRTDRVNVAGTIEVLLGAARHGIRRVVFAGSSSVYGVPESLPCRETFRPAPASPYGVSKLAAEHYVHALGRLHGIDTVVLRYFNVYGPGQDPASEYAAVVPRFITAVLSRSTPTINGDGGVSRDFTHVSNVVVANLLAAAPAAPSGLTCNIACGERHSLMELLDAIGMAAGLPVHPAFGPPRPGDIVHSLADITCARAALGYEVQVPFEAGIAQTVDAFRAAGSELVAR